ncbi:2-dehydro-3-deoxygluconokinase (plasmid) [Ketogulonicigenium robustum]|uniref:2-dehydro-3-deoxygluconokinase n=1 Tax=Ketogulonicigenium robustum TaxID=92947 RepID=A0A1W6P3H7_9RHOB|nr:sugar kinase [Ketogulonicigenium robustum]ARO15897.1 2-dehydro-3-deoxygluconokinase [Ketogulonicigenium robustum]
MDFLCIGEPLVEFTNPADDPARFNRLAGGDTLNTAIYLARLSPAGAVGYLSRLGDDKMSDYLASIMVDEGLVDLCQREVGGRPGLSFITTDSTGERSFTYWRDQAPARRLFSDQSEIIALEQADTLFLSGITLAVLHPQGRASLLAALAARRAAGAQIVLDTNYRPRLWPNAATAAEVIGKAAGVATLVLPSLDDMSGAFGTDDPQEALALLMHLTKAEIVLTTGGGDVLYRAAGQDTARAIAIAEPRAACDTTGAGDSFNAAWLTGRKAGLSIDDAIARAAALAAEVVCYPGAIMPRAAMPFAASGTQ